MISLPDFKEKQILWVNAEWGTPARLRFQNDNIVFEKEGKVVNRASIHKVFAMFIRGDLSLTTNVVKKAKEHGVSICMLKNNFETYGGLTTTAEGHCVLRMKQYACEEKNEIEMARKLVANKIKNQFLLLKEKAEGKRKTEIRGECDAYIKKVKNVKDEKEMLGIEGEVARLYFAEYFRGAGWTRRAPRTKEDITNFLMDMGYTFLFNVMDSILRLHGFDTYKGFYHKLFFQRRSLACDLMEPFRPLVDKQIMKAYNLCQIDEKDFKVKDGAYQLPFDKYNKYATLFLECIMKNKEEIFSYAHGFYQHMMDAKKYAFPKYSLK